MILVGPLQLRMFCGLRGRECLSTSIPFKPQQITHMNITNRNSFSAWHPLWGRAQPCPGTRCSPMGMAEITDLGLVGAELESGLQNLMLQLHWERGTCNPGLAASWSKS